MTTSVFVGADLGGTFLKVVATTGDGDVLGRRLAPSKARAGRDRLLVQIAEMIHELGDEVVAAYPGARLAAIGLAVPGVVDVPVGRVEFTVALSPDWNGFLAAGALADAISLPTRLVNDAQAAALGEHAQGGGRGFRDLLCVTVGTGIGGGLILDGRLYAGSRGMSGVLGHTTVVPEGSPCGCGNRGCLELYASGTAIARDGASAKRAGCLGDWPDDREPSPRALAEAARAGNAAAAAIFEQAGTYLGIALGTAVCLLNPGAIVVGGGVSQAGDVLLDPVRREIARRTAVFSPERGGVEVIQSPLGGDAGAIGSAIWARQGVEGA